MDMTQVDLGQGALVSGAGKTTFRGIVDLLIMDHDTGPLVYATTRAGGEGITVHGVANGRFAQVDHVAFTGDDIAGAVTRLVPLELGTASWMAVTGLDDRAGLHGWAIDGAGHLGSKALQPGGPSRLLDSLRERMGRDRQHILRAKHGDGERGVHRLMRSGQGR